jgi:DNA-binding beta-propeller fold protein YncE
MQRFVAIPSPPTSAVFDRRHFLALAAAFCTGCVPGRGTDASATDLVIGQRGMADGRFQKPRALAVGLQDELFVIDKTARIQVFDAQGTFLRGWKAPEAANGKPTGASIDPRNGNLLVADTHYFRFLTYTPEGLWLEEETIGGENGSEPGQFGWVTDMVRAPDGGLFLAEYGEFDRIYKYSAADQYLDRFGEHGDGPLQFSRPQTLDVDNNGWLWIADACNHRIQVVDWSGKQPRLVKILGSEGTEAGQLRYPYGMKLISEDRVLISEFGNHRVQCWTREGKPLSSWGSTGSGIGQLNQPWGVDVDSRGRVYVVDSGNNRVQRFSLP